jgi:hypothetical protein|tara:strand:+ start:1724 stop:1966 length:243 start_codon:yes stop_codon:yes gene_type:complete
MKRQGLQRQKMTKQKAKLMCKQGGGELDDIMYGSMVEKMTKGTKAKRNAYSAETGVESMQEYGLGGGTHNTYSGKSKRKK